jgi:tetratricopeptide (TPR) repeat protein
MSARSRIMGKQFGRKPALEAVWNGRCWTRAIVGELLAALADCNETLRLKPDVTATLDSRGLIYLKMGQWDSAIDDYNSALRVNPRSASSLYGRGLAKLKKEDTSGGNADIAAAKAIEANIVRDFLRYDAQQRRRQLILSSSIVLRLICGTRLRAQQSSRQWTPTRRCAVAVSCRRYRSHGFASDHMKLGR